MQDKISDQEKAQSARDALKARHLKASIEAAPMPKSMLPIFKAAGCVLSDELQAIADGAHVLVADLKGAEAGIRNHTVAGAREAYQEHHAEITEAAKDHKLGMPSTLVMTREQFDTTYREKLSFFKRRYVEVVNKLFEVVKPAVLDFADKTEALSSEIETQERNVAEGLGLQFEPSLTVIQLLKVSQVAKRYAETFTPMSSANPLEVFNFLGIRNRELNP